VNTEAVPARRPGLGLGAQLALLSLLVFTATLLAGGYAAYTVEQLRTQAVQDAALDTLAGETGTLDELNESLRGDVFARYATLTVDGQMIADLQKLEAAAVRMGDRPEPRLKDLADEEFIYASTAQRLLTGTMPTGDDVSRFRTASARLTERVDAVRTDVAARRAARVAERDASTRSTVARLGGVAAAVAVLLALVSWTIRRHLLVALRSLAATAQAVAGGDLSARTGRAGSDEVGRLAQVLDETSDTLQQSFAEREADARRQAFRGRLDRALAQVDDDEGLSETISRALEQVGRGRPTELLVADSSEAHLTTFAANPAAPAPGCRVTTPWACPAVRGGRIAEFLSADELDACPQLRDRPEGDRSGVCIPISFMGRVLGVLHSAAEPGDLPDSETRYQLQSLAEQTGARLGNLRAFDRIQRQAAVDSLTGLPNRRSFEDAVHKLSVKGTAYGVLLADLDRFKAVNDTYGHAAGDRALQLFSDVLRSALREEDVPCRFGGEEFAVVIPDVDAQGAAEVADRLRLSLSVAVIGSGPPFTVSVGASDSTMARDLAGQLALADAALLAAKRDGRDRCLIANPQLTPIGAEGALL